MSGSMDVEIFKGLITNDLEKVFLNFKESAQPMSGLKINNIHSLQHIQTLIDNQNSDILVVKTNSHIVGLMGIEVIDWPCDNIRIGNEHMWYVLPEFRSRSSLRLINSARIWAKNMACSNLILNASFMASNMHDKVCQFYERIGMEKFETSYIQRI